jgi:hypothetical protein
MLFLISKLDEASAIDNLLKSGDFWIRTSICLSDCLIDTLLKKFNFLYFFKISLFYSFRLHQEYTQQKKEQKKNSTNRQ